MALQRIQNKGIIIKTPIHNTKHTSYKFLKICKNIIYKAQKCNTALTNILFANILPNNMQVIENIFIRINTN